jgi:hypothetical protein
MKKTIKETYLINVAISNNHNHHSTITVKLYKCTDLKDELIRNMANDNGLYDVFNTNHNGYSHKQITINFGTD